MGMRPSQLLRLRVATHPHFRGVPSHCGPLTVALSLGGDESITLNFVRRGNLAMRTTVKWKTQNINVADDSYL